MIKKRQHSFTYPTTARVVPLQNCLVRSAAPCTTVSFDLTFIFNGVKIIFHIDHREIQRNKILNIVVLCILTVLHEYSSQTGDAAHHHADTQGPPPAGTVHGGPQDDVGGQLHSSGQEEVEELVTTEHGRVVGQPHVHAGVGKPVVGKREEYCSLT